MHLSVAVELPYPYPPTLLTHTHREARLTHPTQECQDANACYSIALAHLIQNPGDAEGALEVAGGWVQQAACPAVQQWWREAAEAQTAPPCWEQGGWVRWAFVLAFMHLRLRTGFEEAIRQTLRQGGDTDTNAGGVKIRFDSWWELWV